MKNINNVIICLCILYFYSCSHQKQEYFELEKLYIDINNERFTFYDISDDILPEFDFVRLETTDSCLVSRIHKVLFENDIYYLFDKTNHVIHTFSVSGKYLSTLNQYGPGPNEYVDINAFAVENNNIWIFDGSSQKIICYDSNQKVVDRINLKESGFWADDMKYIDGYLYMINNWIGTKKVCHQILIYEPKSKVLSYHKAFSPLQGVIYRGMGHQIASIDSLCLVSFSYCDTIFQVKDNAIIPKYQFVFSTGLEDKPISHFDNKQEKNELIKGLTNIYQTSNSVVLSFSQGKESRWVVFNKNNPIDSGKTGKIYRGFKIADLGNYRLVGTEITNNSLISFFDDAFAFKQYFEDYLVNNNFKSEQSKTKIKEEVSKIKEYDNPVLFRFTLKKESNL